jgi:hypothetical protein
MAVIKKNILGQLSGRVGDFIYRVRNGKVVAYRRPVKQRVSRSREAVAARNYFSANVKFAAFINSFPVLKNIWIDAKVPGSTHYQKMIKSNSTAAKQQGISVKNMIVPPGIKFKVNGLSLTNSGISFSISLNSSELKKIFSQQSIMHIIFYFHSPVKKTVPAYSFSSIVEEMPACNESNLNVSLPLNDEIRKYMKWYKKAVVFISASVVNPASKKNYWTTTYSEEVEIKNS